MEGNAGAGPPANRRRSRVALAVFVAVGGALVVLVASTIAVRDVLRAPGQRAAEHASDADGREQVTHEAIARGAAAFCRAEIKKQVKAPLVARFEPLEERLGYEPVRGEAYVVGELATQDRGGATVRHEYVCRLKRQGTDWLALVAAIR